MPAEPLSILENLIQTRPALAPCREDIAGAYRLLAGVFRAGGKLLLCGNGGSAADCGHIAGELMKGFLRRRPLPPSLRQALCSQGEEGERLAGRLQGALPCIDLTGHAPLSTAFANDVDPALIFAQQVCGYGRPGDALLAISTSGNAENVRFAVRTAKAMGLMTLGLTGRKGGWLAENAGCCIRVPEDETFRVQELHLPVYHALCAMLEAEFFDE
ncbi:MAG TPA: SIS domain-containing protein [Firmicutes bacterium]|nr:SIS domain-containing protein [Bacillota bacterium]